MSMEPPNATVRRVTAVLDAFLSSEGDLGISELAARLGLAKSVVHRLVTALAEAEYLFHDRTSRRYSLGRRAVRLGLVAVGQLNLRERALPYMRAMSEATGETTTLSVLVGDARVYAEQVESTKQVRQAIQIGASAPLYVGASGKAILAFLPSAQRASLVHQASGLRHADGSSIDAAELQRELDEVRSRGFATSQNERIVGAASSAAPIFDNRGDVVGSISVAGVTVRHREPDLCRFGELAAANARRLSTELGW
jgi:IclR family transcriptional regulator, acetate operon repressor